jgi:hypothetical protein
VTSGAGIRFIQGKFELMTRKGAFRRVKPKDTSLYRRFAWEMGASGRCVLSHVVKSLGQIQRPKNFSRISPSPVFSSLFPTLVHRLLFSNSHQNTMSEKQYIKNRRFDDLATAPTPQNTPATASTLPTPASQAPSIPTITEEDGMILSLCYVLHEHC